MGRESGYHIDLRQAVEEFQAACRAKGLSVTHQRLAVYEAVAGSRAHPGAEEIYRSVREKLPTISRGTVYRILETLCRLGLVNDVNHVGNAARFEAALEPHHHLICLSCQRIIDVRDESLERIKLGRSLGAEAAGFQVRGYQVQFTGYCGTCGGDGKRGKRSRPAVA